MRPPPTDSHHGARLPSPVPLPVILLLVAILAAVVGNGLKRERLAAAGGCVAAAREAPR